jgi:hypothetical protein
MFGPVRRLTLDRCDLGSNTPFFALCCSPVCWHFCYSSHPHRRGWLPSSPPLSGCVCRTSSSGRSAMSSRAVSRRGAHAARRTSTRKRTTPSTPARRGGRRLAARCGARVEWAPSVDRDHPAGTSRGSRSFSGHIPKVTATQRAQAVGADHPVGTNRRSRPSSGHKPWVSAIERARYDGFSRKSVGYCPLDGVNPRNAPTRYWTPRNAPPRRPSTQLIAAQAHRDQAAPPHRSSSRGQAAPQHIGLHPPRQSAPPLTSATSRDQAAPHPRTRRQPRDRARR